MNQKLQEFLERAFQEKKEKEQTQREEHLISLGLVEDEEREYNKVRTGKYRYWDNEKKMYFYNRQKPIEVTDEEYELICKYAPYEESLKQKTSNSNTKKYGIMSSDNGAEKFLGITNIVVCAFIAIVVLISVMVGMNEISSFLPISTRGILGAILGVIIILLLIAVCYCVVRVFLNMSNNLHEIRKSVEKMASKER